jgi:hypothetical protein
VSARPGRADGGVPANRANARGRRGFNACGRRANPRRRHGFMQSAPTRADGAGSTPADGTVNPRTRHGFMQSAPTRADGADSTPADGAGSCKTRQRVRVRPAQTARVHAKRANARGRRGFNARGRRRFVQNAPTRAVRLACVTKCTTVLHNEPNHTRASRFVALCSIETSAGASSGVPVSLRVSPRAGSRIAAGRSAHRRGAASRIAAGRSAHRAVRHGPNLVVTQADRPPHRPRAQTIGRWRRPALEQSPLRVVCYHTPSMRCRSGSHCQHPAEKGRRFCAEHAAELDRMREELKDAAAARIGRGRPKRSSTCCRPGCYEPRVPPAAYCDTCVAAGYVEEAA